jgi:dipeptidyl aminopeptidase/acylaminoacyl peptidase
VTLVAFPAAPVRADLPPLIPRKVLFENPARTGPRLSPDGSRLAYLAPSTKGVSNLWLQTLGKHDERMLTKDERQGILFFRWAADGKHLLYVQDLNGDENWHVYSVDLESRLVRDLTPFLGVRAFDVLVSDKRPNEILVGLNMRDPRVADMYRINLDSGAVTLDTKNPGDVLSWTTDEDFNIRAATAFTGEAATTSIRVRDSVQSPWHDLKVIPFEDSCFWGQVNGGSMITGFTADGSSIYVVDPLKTDKTRLVRIDIGTGKELEEVAADPRCDVEYSLAGFRPLVLSDPKSGKVQAVGFDAAKLEWKVTDPSVQTDFDFLRGVHEGTMLITSRAKDDNLWLVSFSTPQTSDVYYLYNRETKKSEELFRERPELAKYTLAEMEPVVIKSRDGLDLLCYLSVPPGVARKNLALILLPHGGPWWRDRWGFDPWVQLAANRGYAVLQVQYRASTGFGKKFLNAGNRQFGDQAVMGDYLDAVKWAVDSGLADPHRLAAMGASGGGYATLCCLAFHPELEWKCGVDLVGPSSVKTLLESIPSYWRPVKKRWVLRFGDAEHDEDWNQKVSPLYHAAAIRAPVLMGYGLNDPRVHIREATQMATALRENGIDVTLIVYPDEGHGFVRPENNLDFFGRMEEFLAKHLGGRKEPWQKPPGASGQER